MIFRSEARSIRVGVDVTVEARSIEATGARCRGIVAWVPGLGGAPVSGSPALEAWLRLWAMRGWVGLVVDPRSARRGGQPCYTDLTLTEEIDLHIAGLAGARAARGSPLPTFVFGHSAGAMMAPFVASRHCTRGVIVLGAPVPPWSEALVLGARRQLELAGLEADSLEREAEAAARVYRGLVARGLPPSELFGREPELRFSIAARDVRGETLHGRALSFHRELEQLDLRRAWSTSSREVLVVAGGLDWVAVDDDAQRVVAWVREAGGRATLEVVPDLDHDGARFGSIGESFRRRGRGAPHEAAAARIGSWMVDRCG